jgi:CheY-specific phosphatase CheX
MTHDLLESIYRVFEQAFDIRVNALAQPPTDENVMLYSEIGITENGKTKIVVIGMPKKGLIFLSSIYFGSQSDFLDEELEDFLKELSNLIVGKIKAVSSSEEREIKLEIPKIVPFVDLNDYIKKYFKVKESYVVVAY